MIPFFCTKRSRMKTNYSFLNKCFTRFPLFLFRGQSRSTRFLILELFKKLSLSSLSFGSPVSCPIPLFQLNRSINRHDSLKFLDVFFPLPRFVLTPWLPFVARSSWLFFAICLISSSSDSFLCSLGDFSDEWIEQRFSFAIRPPLSLGLFN